MVSDSGLVPGASQVPPIVPDDLKAEHERLLDRTQELEREHRQLQEHLHDMTGHVEHSANLRKQIKALHAHIQRLRGEPPAEEAEPGMPHDAWGGDLDPEYSAMIRSIARAEREDLLRRVRNLRTFASSLCSAATTGACTPASSVSGHGMPASC